MKNTMFVLAPGVIVDELGSDTVVLVGALSEVLTLSGDAATTLRRIRSGENVCGAEAVVSELVARGVIQPAHGISRRSVVRAGVIGAGVGIAGVAMPSVAAASSAGGEVIFGSFNFSGFVGGFLFSPQPMSAVQEIRTYLIDNPGAVVELELPGTTTKGTWNDGLAGFQATSLATDFFGTSVEATWMLGAVPRTQTFNRTPDLG